MGKGNIELCNLDKVVAVVSDDELELIAYQCKTIEDASKWLGCSRQALYKSMHMHGKMAYKGFKVELIHNERGL